MSMTDEKPPEDPSEKAFTMIVLRISAGKADEALAELRAYGKERYDSGRDVGYFNGWNDGYAFGAEEGQ